MNFNKTLIEKSNLYNRLCKRWKRLPRNWIANIAMNHQVNEEILNRIAIDNYNKELRKRLDEYRNKEQNGLVK